eukprot:321238-Prymnesium_polylepis.1
MPRGGRPSAMATAARHVALLSVITSRSTIALRQRLSEPLISTRAAGRHAKGGLRQMRAPQQRCKSV